MGEPDENRLYSQLIRHALIELRDRGDVSLSSLRSSIEHFSSAASRNAAGQRLNFAERHLSETAGINFSEVVRPGRVLVVDLRQPLFSREDALRFFLVCANQISRVQGAFNKMVIFDEAHEYLSEAFGEKLDSRIRLSRHEGTSYIFATQDVSSIPTPIQRFISTKCVFGLGSHQNVRDLVDFAPEFKGFDLVQLRPGQCLVQSTFSAQNVFATPKPVAVRPRATAHGGTTRVFA
jgi:DNA helicase HerA-like ATPase